jgi:hypothetical protein
MCKSINITIFVLFLCVQSYADTGFTFGNAIDFKFIKNKTIIHSPDSLSVLCNNGSGIDTLFIGKHRTEHYQNWLRSFENGLYNIDGYASIKEFKVILYLDNIRYESKYIKVFGGRNYFIFEIQNNTTLRDVSPLFYVHWAYYLKAFILTLFLESAVVLLFFWLLKENVGKFLITLIICNIFTHPTLWLICSHINIPLVMLELSVSIIETLVVCRVFRNKTKMWIIILITILANFMSWLLGGIALAIWA